MKWKKLNDRNLLQRIDVGSVLVLKNDARQSVRDISLQFDIGVAITHTILTGSFKIESFFAPISKLLYIFLKNPEKWRVNAYRAFD